jgi:predicted TPR repeat methyltransferase
VRKTVPYQPEPYWSRVADEIQKRGQDNLIAGDDDPYYRYKRKKFLTRFLNSVDFRSKVVLEVGPGPGGNLLHAIRAGAKRVIGIDISQQMLDLAAKTLVGYEDITELKKTDGQYLPLPDRSVDLAFTVTVLHHNSDPGMFQHLVASICRVSKDQVVFIEDTSRGSTKVGSDGSFVGRPVAVYEAECRKHGFELIEREYLGLRFSRTAHLLLRRLLLPAGHREGDPYGFLPIAVLKGLLFFTRALDSAVPDNRDLTKMCFARRYLAAG